jgi:hypothetical protein
MISVLVLVWCRLVYHRAFVSVGEYLVIYHNQLTGSILYYHPVQQMCQNRIPRLSLVLRDPEVEQ